MINELRNVRFMTFELRSLLVLRDRLSEDVLSLKSTISEPVSGTKDIDRLYAKVDTCVDLDVIVDTKIYDLKQQRTRLFDGIMRLGDANERVVLIDRYLNAKSWKEMSSDMRLSERQLRNIHNSAILHLEAI